MRRRLTLALLVPALAACHDETAPSIYNAQGAWFDVSLQTGDVVLTPEGVVSPSGTVRLRAFLEPGLDVLGRDRRAITSTLRIDGAPTAPQTDPRDADAVWARYLVRSDDLSTNPMVLEPPPVVGLAQTPAPLRITTVARGGPYALSSVARGEAIRLPVRLPAPETKTGRRHTPRGRLPAGILQV